MNTEIIIGIKVPPALGIVFVCAGVGVAIVAYAMGERKDVGGSNTRANNVKNDSVAVNDDNTHVSTHQQLHQQPHAQSIPKVIVQSRPVSPPSPPPLPPVASPTATYPMPTPL